MLSPPLHPGLAFGGAVLLLLNLPDTIARWRADLAFKPADVAFAQGRFDDFVTHAERTLLYDPRHYRAHTRLAIVKQKRAELDQALAHTEAVATYYPYAPNNSGLQALILSDLHRQEDSVAAWSRLLTVVPWHEIALRESVRLYVQLDRTEDSIRCCRQLIKYYPENPEYPAFLKRLLTYQETAPKPIEKKAGTTDSD